MALPLMWSPVRLLRVPPALAAVRLASNSVDLQGQTTPTQRSSRALVIAT